MTRRIAVFAFGIVSYLVFLATFLYALGFVGGFLVPTTLDEPARMPLLPALAIDLGLLALFALQHSVMARPAFKQLVDAVRPAADRAQHLRACVEPRADRALRAVAADLAAWSGRSVAPLAAPPAALFASAGGWCSSRRS